MILIKYCYDDVFVMNYQWVKSFIALVEEQHFTRAAEKLHMTQPGLSQHISKLEALLGHPLLQRIGKGFELTPAGLKLFNYGKQMCTQELQFLDSLNQDDPISGQINIACSGTLAMLLYPILLERQQNHPGLSIHLEAAPNARIIDLVLKDACEVGLITMPSHHKKLTELQIGKQTLALILPAKITQLNNDIPSFAQLQETGFINHPDGHHYAELILQHNYAEAFNCMNSIPERGFINQLHQILSPVSKGLGFTALPEIAIQYFDDPMSLSIPQLPHPVTETIFLVKKQYKPLPARYDWFIKGIKDTFLSSSC